MFSLFFDNAAFDGDAFADHFLDVPLFDFDDLFLLDVGQSDHPFAFGCFEQTIFFDAFDLDLVCALFVAHGDNDLSLFVFVFDFDFFFGGDSGRFGFQPLFFLDFGCFGVLAGSDLGDFSLLFLLCFDPLSFQFVQRFVPLDVLLLDRLGFFDVEVVPLDVFLRCQFGDLLDAFRVEDVARG